METYKVRYWARGRVEVMYFTECENREEALRRAEEAKDCGFDLLSVRKVRERAAG